MPNSDTTKIIVTTVDLREDYEVIGPVYAQVANKGEFQNHLQGLREVYAEEIEDAIAKGLVAEGTTAWTENEYASGQIDFEHAFFIAVRELQRRASLMGADAVVGMRHDIDMDIEVSFFFFLQIYGTAVRLRK